MEKTTVTELKKMLSSASSSKSEIALALDIDETLSATNVKWFERCAILFGNPDGLTTMELITKYHLAQNNPSWQTEEAKEWMSKQRTAPEAQDDLPLVPGAFEGVKILHGCNNVRFVAYLTVRPENVAERTIHWLQQQGFPNLPVVLKPLDVPFEDGNKWKADALRALYPDVSGIVDDNPKVPKYVGSSYMGKVYLFGRDATEPEYKWAIPCLTWANVVEKVRKDADNAIARAAPVAATLHTDTTTTKLWKDR